MSDWGAQKTTVESALAGLDMAMPGDGGRNPYNSYWGGMLTEAVLNGTIPEWRLDDSMDSLSASFFATECRNRGLSTSPSPHPPCRHFYSE